MPVDCRCGFSFYISGHLWLVVAELFDSPTKIVIVNLTTKREGSDTTVILKLGDHPFVKHDTVVNYSDARIFSKDDLIAKIERKFFSTDKIFAENILRTIQQGLLISPYTPKGIKESCRAIFQNNVTSGKTIPDEPSN
jgi:hypothetical protein